MKKRILQATVTAVSLLLAASISFGEVKKPDQKNAAKPVEKAASAVKSDAKAGDTVKPAVKKELIDINSAGEADLKSIAGIGDAYASKIIAGRPYANKTQLKSRGIIPGALYEQIKEQIIAKQLKKDGKPDDKSAPKGTKK